MVAFQQQRIAIGKMRQNMRCGVAKIRQKCQFSVAVSTGQLQRFFGIMRDGERRDLQGTQVNCLAVAGDMQQTLQNR